MKKKLQLFSNITNQGIPQYIQRESVSQNIDDLLMKAIIKYRLHPSVIAIKNVSEVSLLVSLKLNMIRS